MAQKKKTMFITTARKGHDGDGSDLPNGGGTVSDEDIQAITGENDDRPTGQDHSTDNHEHQAPTEGVGAIQDQSRHDFGHCADSED